MIARFAAGLAAGLTSLFATAALACTGPTCGPYTPAAPGLAFGPPPVAAPFAPPAFAPPPPQALAPAAPLDDERPWPPAYAPSRYGPTIYLEGGHGPGAAHAGFERREHGMGFAGDSERRGGYAHIDGHGACGLCAPMPPPLPLPPPACPTACEANLGEAAPRISEAFFVGSGGAGPGLEIAGPAGGGFFGFSSGSFGFAGAHSFAYASAHASATAHSSVKVHGKPHGCGCGGKGK